MTGSTVELPVLVRFNGQDHVVGTISVDITAEVQPQIEDAGRAVAHAIAPCEVSADTAAQPWVYPDAAAWPGEAWGRLLWAGLNAIATRGCEHFTVGSCWKDGRTADARYGADRACAPCIAARVLRAQELPFGPGRHAEEGR